MPGFLMLLKSLSTKILNISNIYPQQIQDKESEIKNFKEV